jgi:hypothetical protein
MLSDSSVLLNLLAGDCLASIGAVTGWQFAICPAVRDGVKRLRDGGTGDLVEMDLTPHFESGVLQVLELSGEEEQALYVEQSVVVDDGEAMSIAMAAHRHLDLAIDDKKAANHARRTFPCIQLWTTPEIIKYWAETGSVADGRLGETIRLIEVRARYFPPKSHALGEWWRQSKNGEA